MENWYSFRKPKVGVKINKHQDTKTMIPESHPTVSPRAVAFKPCRLYQAPGTFSFFPSTLAPKTCWGKRDVFCEARRERARAGRGAAERGCRGCGAVGAEPLLKGGRSERRTRGFSGGGCVLWGRGRGRGRKGVA